MIKTGYSIPKLFGTDITREWYVGFRHTCPNCLVRKPYQVRMGLNFHRTIAERTAEGKAIANILKRALADNWNPHHESIEDYLRRTVEGKQLTAAEEIGNMPFSAALEFALNEKRASLAKKSFQCFTTAKEYAQKAAVSLGLFDMPVKDTKRAHIKTIMAEIVKQRQRDYDKAGRGQMVTGNFYNKYKGYLQCIFSELVEFEALEYNPCDKIKDRPKITTNIHRHATPAERALIKSTLQLKSPRFYIYLLVEYMTGIRPKEIFHIRVCDIDWFNQAFVLHPYEGATKTRASRHVPIPNALMKYLRSMKLEDCNPLHYVFSDAFRPGEARKSRDYATKTWKELIKDGLKLNVSLYSFKGLGGEDKREAGIGLGTVQKQFGHTKQSTTMIYLHGEQARMDQELRERTPEL